MTPLARHLATVFLGSLALACCLAVGTFALGWAPWLVVPVGYAYIFLTLAISSVIDLNRRNRDT